MMTVKIETSQFLPVECKQRLAVAVSNAMVEWQVDKSIPRTSVDIERFDIEINHIKHNDIIGPQPSQREVVHVESSDIEPDESDEPVEICDYFKPAWGECVSIAHRGGRFHHKISSPRIIRGVPNRLFTEAKAVWERLPEQIVGKEERKRIRLKTTAARLRMRATRLWKKQLKQSRMQAQEARMQALQNGPASKEA